MKKFIIVLFVILGVAVKDYAKIVTKISKNFEKKAVLTNDRSKLFILHILEEKKITLIDRKCTEITNKIIDTVRIYFISTIARNYINDSIASWFIDNQSVALPDSLVPRWTHLFGQETYIKRELRIVGNDILFFNVNSKSCPAVFWSDFLKLLIVAGVILIICFYLVFFVKEKDVAIGILATVLLFVFLLLVFIHKPLVTTFDIIFVPFLIIFPSLFTLFIKTKEKEEILEKHIRVC